MRLLRTQSWETSLRLRQELEEVEDLIKSSHDSKKADVEKKIVAKIATEPGLFYKYASSFSKVTSKVGPLKTIDFVLEGYKIHEIHRFRN